MDVKFMILATFAIGMIAAPGAMALDAPEGSVDAPVLVARDCDAELHYNETTNQYDIHLDTSCIEN